MIDKDFQEQNAEAPLSPFDFKVQLSTVYTSHRFNSFQNASCFPLSPCPNSFQNEEAEFETSLDKQMYRINAGLVRKAAFEYLKQCLCGSLSEDRVFEDGNTFCFSSYCEQQNRAETIVEQLVINNRLISHYRKNILIDHFKEFGELLGLFREIKEIFGKTLAQELTFILDELLNAKLASFKILGDEEVDGLIPKIERFWGDDNDEKLITGTWSTYEELNYEEIKKFASTDVEILGSQIYFSKRLKYLSLSQVNEEVRSDVSVVDKFSCLVAFFSETVYLTIGGMCQEEADLQQFLEELPLYKSEGCLEENHPKKKVKFN